MVRENSAQPVEEKTICPLYAGKKARRTPAGEFICEEYNLIVKCPIDNARYIPSFDFESMTLCKTEGIITPEQANYLKEKSTEQRQKNETSRLEKINKQVARFSNREENPKLAEA